MGFLIFSGILGLIFGILLLAIPGKLKKLEVKVNAFINRIIGDADSFIFKYNQGIGICFLMSGLTLLFVAYYLSKT